MFSLIITIIAVALVAALAVATIYYGGSAFTGGSASAAAGALITQGSQITAAGTLYSVEHTGAAPGSIQTIPAEYLKSVPVPPTGAYLSGDPSAADWGYYAPGSMHVVIRDKISTPVCLDVNKRNGFSGIPATLKSSMIVQCYGASEPYTFYYDPSVGTVDERQQIAEAQGGDGTGYPVLCPDGSTITSGACPDAAAGDDDGSGDDGSSGSAVAFSPASISSGPYDYGNVAQSWSDVTIENTGANPLTIDSLIPGGLVHAMMIGGGGPSLGVDITDDGCSGSTLALGATCSFTARTTVPGGSTPGTYHTSISVKDSDGSIVGTIPVSMTTVDAWSQVTVAQSPAGSDLGSHTAGYQVPVTVTLTNNSDVELTSTNDHLTLQSDDMLDYYDQGQPSSTCEPWGPSGIYIPAHGSCTVSATITFPIKNFSAYYWEFGPIDDTDRHKQVDYHGSVLSN